MAIKIEVIDKYMILSFDDGTTKEWPTKQLRYRDDSTNITLVDVTNNNLHYAFTWTDLVDKDGQSFPSKQEALSFLRNSTGGEIATELATDYYLEVSRGNVEGVSHINKFGVNKDIGKNTREDVWDGGGDYPFPTTAEITHIRQASNQSAMQGGTIEVNGLDANWDEVTLEHAFMPYSNLGEKTDIKITAIPDSEDGDVAAGFGLILVDD